MSTCEAKEKNKSAKQMAKIVMKEGGEDIRVSPSHFGKNKWTEAAWIKEAGAPETNEAEQKAFIHRFELSSTDAQHLSLSAGC